MRMHAHTQKFGLFSMQMSENRKGRVGVGKRGQV
jgi:hypothetical protein